MMRVSLRAMVGGALRAAFVALMLAASSGALMLAAPSGAMAATPSGFGVARFEAGTCKEDSAGEPCTYATESKFFTQAAGHPNYGITDFEFNSVPVPPAAKAPIEGVRNLRVDLPAGLSVNPEAIELCTMAAFGETELSPGTGFYPPSACGPESIVGTDTLTVVLEVAPGIYVNVPLSGTVYNLEQPQGVPAEFGVAVDVTSIAEAELKIPLPPKSAYVHTLLEGGVSWHSETLPGEGGQTIALQPSGDYHEYFKINKISNALPLLESRLVFEGVAGTGFLTMPSVCSKATTQLWVEDYKGETEVDSTTPPAEVSGCDEVKFEPEVKVEAGSKKSDAPNGATVKVLLPQKTLQESAIDSSALKDATVTLPEGMTLNPSVATGLEACSDKQFGKGEAHKVECPAGSEIGQATIETPTLPKGSLTGGVYVGQPLSNVPSSGDEYRIFINAESERYGVAVRLEGKVKANESTGQLMTLVTENPQLPFSEFSISLDNASHTPLANPLVCGIARTAASFAPYTGVPATVSSFSPFTIDFNGEGGACPSALPFGIEQSTTASPTTGGASSGFTLNLTRPEGNQYLSEVSTTLPEGLVARIPAVPLCGEAEVAGKSCPASSAIGTATVTIGSGPKPYPLSGTVYLTGPMKSPSLKAYPSPPEGAPYGMLVLVNAEKVGPYNYGIIATKATINVNPYTAQVVVSSALPTIEGGVPLRMRSLSIAITHEGFMLNPTSCSALATETKLTSTMGAMDSLSTPFQATGCEALAFKPTFKAYSNARHTRKNGASLKVDITQKPGEASIRSVTTTLPAKLPSRESTLKGACPEATFAGNPFACPMGSRVGGASVQTPTLRGTLTGPVYIVSHGGRAFPDLDIVLKGDGVTVILVGNTNIKKGITHTKFLAVPDVPITSFKLKLPVGKHSILSGNGKFCKKPMYMPTTIIAQNGKKVIQKTRIHISECPVEVVKHRVKGDTVTLTVKTASAGKISVSGRFLRRTGKTVKRGGRTRLVARLSASGMSALRAHGTLKVRIKVGFKPKRNSSHTSKAFVSATLRTRAPRAHFRGRG